MVNIRGRVRVRVRGTCLRVFHAKKRLALFDGLRLGLGVRLGFGVRVRVRGTIRVWG